MIKRITALLVTIMVLAAAFGAGIVLASGETMDVSVVDGKIIVDAEGDFGEKDWIGIYKQGESVDPNNGGSASLVWWYIGEDGGTVTLPDDIDQIYNNRLGEFIDGGKIIPGQYTVMALADDGYELIDDIDPVDITIDPAESDVAIDYDASSFVGSEFQQIYWNGIKFNNYENGESPLTALKTVLHDDGKVHDEGGTGFKVGLAGWVGFEQDIVAFGSIINDTVIWNDAFDKGTDSNIRSDSKGGKYAKKYEVEFDISKQTGEYTIGVVAALADGTVVKLNSTADPELSTFVSFVGPEKTDPADLEIETGDDVDKVPGAVLIFDAEDKYSPFFDGINDMVGIEYSSELKCFVVTMDNSYDPNFTLSFPKLVLADEMKELSADEYKVISIGVRYDSSRGNKGQLFYQTDEHPGYIEEQSFHITYGGTSDYQAVQIDLRKAENWAGTVAACRLDPLPSCIEHCDYELYYIAFFKTMAGAVEFGQNWENAMKNGTEMAPYATATPEPTKAPTEAPTEVSTTVPTAEATDIPATDSNQSGDTNTTDPKDAEPKKGLGTGAIIGIIAGGAAVVAVIAAIVVSKRKNKK